MASCLYCSKETGLFSSSSGEAINYYYLNTVCYAWCADCGKRMNVEITMIREYGNREQKTFSENAIRKMVNDSSIAFLGDKKEKLFIKVK